MRNKNFPTISIVIATHNSSRTIKRCLESIRSQRYPQEKIEIIIADGASTDATRSISSSFNVRWIAVDSDLQSAEYNKSIGIGQSRNEIIAMIDHDNVLPHEMWFKNMLQPFCDQKDVVGVETLRYHYDPSTSLLDRYFALFGAGDPIVWYLGKADRLSYLFDQCSPAWHARDKGSYFLVRFREDNMPTIGANGFLVRRKILLKNAQTSPGTYFDMDINIDLIKKGYDTYAFVKDSILHLTGYGSVWYFLQRRLLFLTQYRFKVRRYGVLTRGDTVRLIGVVIICSTLIIPLYDSIRGWRKIHDAAWFLHPFLCMSMLILYTWSTLRYITRVYEKRLLGK